MKRIFAVLCLVVFSVLVTADEAAYQTFLERDPDYVKVKNEYDLKKAEYESLDATVKSPEYYRAQLEFWLKHSEKLMLETQLCAAAEEPEDLALIREHFMLIQSQSPFDLDKLPKKDISGSPEFQFVMYVADRVKEIPHFMYYGYFNLETKPKKDVPGSPFLQYIMHRVDQIIFERSAYLIDDVSWVVWEVMRHHLKKVAFDDPECRKIIYEKDYVKFALDKRNRELELENIELYIELQKTIDTGISNHTSPIKQEGSYSLGGEMREKKEADPVYSELSHKSFSLFHAQREALENFAEQNKDSALPEVKEYLEFEKAWKEAASR